MAKKVMVTIDADKARDLLVKRTYQNKQGQTVEVKEIKFELIEMKQESQKILKDAEKYTMVKTHFAVKPQTKADRDANADTVFVGEGVTTEWKNENQESSNNSSSNQSSSDVADDLPF